MVENKFDLTEHMEEQKVKRGREFMATLEFAASLFNRIPVTDLITGDTESMAKGCFKAADDFFKVAKAEEQKRV